MSRGDLQEMEVGTKQSKTAVNANAAPAQPMPKLTTGGTPPTYEDLGGPTPENYKVDNDSAKLKTPAGSLKQVSDAVTNRKGKTAKEEVEVAPEEETLEETPTVTDEKVVEEETVEETYDMEDDVNALLGGEELSEEFKEKAKTIFEAAISAKVSEIKKDLQEKHDATIAEEVASVKSELQERTDSYLEYVAQEWLTENQLAVEAGLKSEMTESFLSGMKSLFEDHYVNIPEEKYDVVSTMVEKLDDMETKLNEQIEKNVALNARLAESTSDVILADVSEGLAATQKEKLATLAEGVEFESEESYKEKLTTLRESYFSSTKVATQSSADTLTEGVESPQEDVAPSMETYMSMLGKMN